MKYIVYALLFSMVLLGCKSKSSNDIYQEERETILNVAHLVQEIQIDNPIISAHNRILLASKYWIVYDFKSIDKHIHLFDRKDFNYVTSIGDFGRGPTEITGLGHICYDSENNSILVPDHGQLKVLSYNIDSVSTNSHYIPIVKTKLNSTIFPDRFFKTENNYIGTIIIPQGVSGYNQVVGEWNINTGKIYEMSYKHPNVKKSRVSLAISNDNKLYATCQHLYDLITVCDYNGNLKFNIYGPQWSDIIGKEKNQLHYWNDIEFCKNKLIASFSGRTYHDDNYWPTSLIIFDIKGNYEKTLEIGYNIMDFCYDDENNRIIMSLEDEIQFAYISLDNII